jgi:hypothetical protein
MIAIEIINLSVKRKEALEMAGMTLKVIESHCMISCIAIIRGRYGALPVRRYLRCLGPYVVDDQEPGQDLTTR